MKKIKINKKMIVSLIYLILAASLVMIFIIRSSDSDTHESLSKEMLTNLEELAEILESVTDSSGVVSGIKKTKRIKKKIKKTEKKMEVLENPSEKDRIKGLKDIDKVSMRITLESYRLSFSDYGGEKIINILTRE